MKRLFYFAVLLLAAITFSPHANAQLWKRIKKEVKNRAENHVVNDVGNATDKAIDKSEETAADAAKGNPGNRGNNREEDNAVSGSSNANSNSSAKASDDLVAQTPAPSTIASYKNYDFVPGDKIIFETDFKNQRDAEVPAQLGILSGTAEIQSYKGEKVLHLEKGNKVCVVPMIDNVAYLPQQYTVEFDFLFNSSDPTAYNWIEMSFYNPKSNNEDIKDNNGIYRFYLYEAYRIDFGNTIQRKNLSQSLFNSLKIPDKWHHVAIYVHNNIGKVYIDQYRVGATNMMTKGASKLAIKTSGDMEYMIKNLRIAGGGSDAYNKIMTDGKLITHGIYFASGKSTILPESMGTINQVFHILQNHSDLKFEIAGYTDNDGSPDLNLKLSQQRADAVKHQLVKMGIDASRLTTKGFGETKPIDKNTTPEGKANNRRVEFVKI